MKYLTKHQFSKKPLISGLLLLALGVVWIFFISSQLVKLPTNFSLEASLISTDNFYDEERGDYLGDIYSRTKYSFETIHSDKDNSTIKNSIDVRTPDDELIFSVDRTYGIDRKTNKHIKGLGDKDRDGYLSAPRYLDINESFVYWHVNYDAPAQMEYVSTETLYGLTTYKYNTRYEDVAVDQTSNLTHLPGVGVTRGVRLDPYLELWIEPTTGSLVKYKDQTTANFYDLETNENISPWNMFTNTFEEHSIQENVSVLKWEKTKTKVIDTYIPILLLIFGFWLIGKATGLNDHLYKKIPPQLLAGMSGWLIVGVALISLFGWFADIESLTRIIPHASAMNPMTAICFVLLGGGIAFNRKSNGKITTFLGIVISVIGLMRLASVFGVIPFEIDLLVLGDKVTSYPVPARMAQYTSMSFLITGIALSIQGLRKMQSIKIVEILASVVTMFSFFTVFGFLFDALSLLSTPIFFSSAVHTALLFLFSGIAIFVLFRQRSGTLKISGWVGITGILFISILLTVVVANMVDRTFSRESENTFQSVVETTTDSIQDRTNIYINLLQGGRGLFTASDEVNRQEWKAYIGSLEIDDNYPGAQGIGYSVFLDPDEISSHEESIRAQGFPEYSVRPAGDRDIYSSIIYLEPFDLRNQQAFGYDMFSNPIRRAAMEQARDTGEPRMSGKITLVQEVDDDVQPGFLIYVPKYEKESEIETLSDRRDNIVGYVYGAFRSRNFIEAVIGIGGIDDIGIEINDGIGQISEDTLLYEDTSKKLGVNERSRFTDTRTIYIAGRPWVITFSSTASFGGSIVSTIAPLFLVIIGIGVSILITLVFHTLISSRQKAVKYAEEATEDIQAAKAKDEAMLLSIGDGLIATDEKGVIEVVNEAFESMLGWKKVEVVGRKLIDVLSVYNEDGSMMPHKDRPIHQALENKMVATGFKDNIQYKKKDGSLLPVDITVSPIILDDGKLVGAVEVFRDITEERSIDRAKSEFVSLASHQLRTPLSAIGWYTEMLIAGDAGKINKEQKKYLEEIYAGNQRMVSLVKDLLNVSRLELGTFMVEPEELDVVKLAKDVLKEQKLNAKDRGVKITADFPKDKILMNADPKLLRMIFQNLLSNAIKYTQEGGNVQYKAYRENDDLNIVISDNGWGIPLSEQPKIFNKLFRAGNVKEKDAEGTGLGLYIIKSIVEHSHGEIWFESEENEGTSFYVKLPLDGMTKKDGEKELDS